MKLDLDNINQFSTLLDQQFFLPFYQRINCKAQVNHAISYLGPFIGLTDGFFSSIQAIGGVAEASIKAIGNIFKSIIICNKTSFKRGSLQLFGAIIITIASIPRIVYRTLNLSIQMTKDPISTSHNLLENYQKNQSLIFV